MVNKNKTQKQKRKNNGKGGEKGKGKGKGKGKKNKINTEQNTINIVYQLLKDVHDIMGKFNIKYFIEGGTTLGAVRHKGMIPWDDDADITVMNDKRTVKLLNSKEFKEYLKKYNYGIIRSNHDYKIYQLDGEPMKLNPWTEHWKLFQVNNPHIRGRVAIWREASKTYDKNKKRDTEFAYPYLDVFVAKEKKVKKGDDEIIFLNTFWNKCNYKKKHVFPLKKYKFHTYEVWGPNNPKEFFDNCYGKDWNDIAYKYVDHVNTHITDAGEGQKIKFKLNKSHRKPAKATVKIISRIGKLDNVKPEDMVRVKKELGLYNKELDGDARATVNNGKNRNKTMKKHNGKRGKGVKRHTLKSKLLSLLN